MCLEQLQSLLDQVAENHALSLVVHDTVTKVDVAILENVQHGQNLAVVGHQSLANHLTGNHKLLDDLQHNHYHNGVTGVESSLDRDDELRDDREDLGAAMFEHIEGSLNRDETVGLLLLAEAIKENREVVVVVKFLNVNLPLDLVPHSAFLNEEGQVPTLIEPPKLRVWRVVP